MKARRARMLLAAALAFLWLPGASGQTPLSPVRELRIATYNVQNYGPADRMTETGFRPDYPKPEREKAALRSVIRSLDADVLALQEMGPAEYLEELQRDLRSEGLDYPYAVLGQAVDQERHVALLSRLPLTSVTTHADVRFKYFAAEEVVKRGVLEATVSTAGGPVTFFVVHLKSRFTDRADDPQSAIRRSAEATAVRNLVLERFPDPAAAQYVLFGDCNDTKASKTLAHLQKRGQTPVLVLLAAADSRGETWTHCYRREDVYSRVDYILLSPGLQTVLAKQSAVVFDSEGVRTASDHRPVLATLTFRSDPRSGHERTSSGE